MISQDKNTGHGLIEAGIELADEMSIKSELCPKKGQPLKDNKSLLLMTGTFGSRGSAMLKAALSDSNRQDNKISAKERAAIYEEQKRARLAQQASLKRIRSPKNKVLFTEPVVTKHFEYEPTLLGDLEGGQHGSSSSDCDDPDRPKKTIAQGRRGKFRTGGIRYTKSAEGSNTQDKQTLTESSNSHEPVAVSNNPKKRPYDDDAQVGGNSSESSLEEGGSLFSSPKVAKIAPYYHDQLSMPTQNLKSAHNKSNKQHRSQRLCLSNENRVPMADKIQIAETREPVPKSLSIETAPNIQLAIDNIHPQHGYFAWITNGLNYLSDQMNKLIF